MSLLKIQEILDSLSESDLVEAVFDMERLSETSILDSKSVIRELAVKITTEFPYISMGDARAIVEKNILTRAAHLWAMNYGSS